LTLKLGDALRRSTTYLERKGVPSPRVDAEHLLAKALELTRVQLYIEHDRPLTAAELDDARRLVKRRGRREPLAYILGEWGFRRLTLRTDARALIPRPESEIVVERCLELLRDVRTPNVLELGVGSGAIALAIADERADATLTGVDVSAPALALARENAKRAGLAERVRLLEADFSDRLELGPFDLVVSNPPYVSPEEVDALEPEVRDWEPRGALVDPAATDAVIRAASDVLRPGGWLVVETHEGQARSVADWFAAAAFRQIRITTDLAGKERVVEGQCP
jgi:release factor glutamine methyltransferase